MKKMKTSQVLALKKERLSKLQENGKNTQAQIYCFQKVVNHNIEVMPI